MPGPPQRSRAAAALILLVMLAVAAVIAVTASFGGRTAEESPSNPQVGVHFHGFWNYDTETEMLTALQAFKDAGGSWVRVDVGWGTIEPLPGHYSASVLRRYDAAIEAAHGEGLNVLLVFLHAPAWANGSDDRSLAPQDVSDFGDFAVDIANRYAGQVQAIELWN